MLNENPCINCITHSICKARIIGCIASDDYDINNSMELREVITTAYFKILTKKCSIIENYINQLIKLSIDETIKRKEQDDSLYTYRHVVQVVCQTMYESFNIKDIIKELKHVQ